MVKVEKRHLTDPISHVCSDVLKAGRRKNPYECGGIAEIRVQGEGVLILDDVRAMIRTPFATGAQECMLIVRSKVSPLY